MTIVASQEKVIPLTDIFAFLVAAALAFVLGTALLGTPCWQWSWMLPPTVDPVSGVVGVAIVMWANWLVRRGG